MSVGTSGRPKGLSGAIVWDMTGTIALASRSQSDGAAYEVVKQTGLFPPYKDGDGAGCDSDSVH